MSNNFAIKLGIAVASLGFLLASMLPAVAQGQPSLLEIQEIEFEVDGDDVQISWFTPVKSAGCVKFGPSTSSGQSPVYELQICSILFERIHIIQIENLKLKTIYHFQIEAKAPGFSPVSSFDNTFKTGKERTDGEAPKIEDVRIAWIGATAATVRWVTDEPADSRVEYGETSEDLRRKSGSGRREIEHEVTIKGLRPGTSYHLRVSSEDEDDIRAFSDVKRFRTAFDSRTDTNPLRIDKVRPLNAGDSAIGETTTTFSWRTSRPAEGIVRYGARADRLFKRVSVTRPRTLEHEIVVDDLEPGTQYYFRIESRDVLGKRAESPGKDGVHSIVTRGARPIASKNSTSRTAQKARKRFSREAQPSVTIPVGATTGQPGQPKVLGAFTYIYTPANALLKTDQGLRIYAVLNPSGKQSFRHWLKSAEIFQGYGYRQSDVATVSVSQLASLPALRLAKVPASPEVFFLDSARNLKLHLPSAEVFTSYKSNTWKDIATLNPQDLESFEDATLVKLANRPKVYFLERGLARPIATEEAFNRFGFDWGKIMTINQVHLDASPVGAPVE